MNAGFRRREVTLASDEVHHFDPSAWDDAVVLVEHGEIELETVTGERRGFGAGALLCFAGLPLRSLRNPGPVPVTLIAMSRRGTDSFPDGTPSHGREHGREQGSCPRPSRRRPR